jgi:peptide/nickel transport system permease protein
MIRFIVRRLLSSIPVLLGVVLLVFILARVIPGDPCRAALGERATAAVCDDFERRYGLDQPLPLQFGIYLLKLAGGDLGSSIRFGRPVADILLDRLPLTLELTLFALIFATFFGVLLGILSALRRNSPVDVGTMIVANLGVSTPVFVLGLLLQIIFAVALRDTLFSMPPSGRLTAGASVVPLATTWGLQGLEGPLRGILDFVSNIYLINTLITGQWATFWDAVKHLLLPAIAVGTIPLAIIARMTRSSLLEVLGLDYIRTARAKGLRERAVVVRHGLRNAMLPVVTVIGLSLGAFLSGAVLTETIFNLAGIGRTIVEAITGRDYIVIQGVTIVIAIGYLLVNLIVDVSYAVLDPRIRLS